MKKRGIKKGNRNLPRGAGMQVTVRSKRGDDPLAGPVDFSRFGAVRRDAFAGAGERGGPSLLALWEMPEIPPGAVMLRRGRPRQGERMETKVCSVRLPTVLWNEAAKKAKSKHLNMHQAMRAALIGWMRKAG